MNRTKILVLACTCLATGMAYTLAQIIILGTIADAVFVSMLLFATALMLWALWSYTNSLHSDGIRFYGFISDQSEIEIAKQIYDELIRRMTSTRWQIVSGVVYSSIVASVVYFLVWPEHPLFRWLLVLFIWTINFVTGVGFYSMIMFLNMSKRMAMVIPVSLWMPNTPPVRFLLRITRKIGILTSIYVSICISSILFSVMPIQGLVSTYAVFSLICILCSITIPAVSIANRRSESKMNTIDELDARVCAEYERISKLDIHSIPSTEFESLQHLLELRDRVTKAPCWPFRIGAVSTGGAVVLVSSLPVIIQVVMEWYVG